MIQFTIDSTDVDQRLAAIGKELEKNIDNWEAWAAKADIYAPWGSMKSQLGVAIGLSNKSR